MYCPMCGKETPDCATFCPACGTNLTGWRKRPAPALRTDKEGRTEPNEAVRTIKARVQTRRPLKRSVGICISLFTFIACCGLALAVTQGWISLPNISILQIPFASNGGGETPTGADNYEYWNSPTDSSYYLLNSGGKPAVKVTGKPFMVLTRDRISLNITDCEFGLSEVTQEVVGDEGFPEPTLNAEMIDFHEKLGLKSPVDLIVSWSLDLPGGGNKTPIVNGVQQFSFLHPANAIGPGKNSEKWVFNYTGRTMTGGVARVVGTNPSIESGTNAFALEGR